MKLLTFAPTPLLTISVVFMLLENLSPASAALPKYGLHTWQKGKRTLVQVYNLKTKQTIWTHSYPGIDETYPDNGKFFWSPDRRAVAFAAESEAQSPRRKSKHLVPFTIWRAGKRVHTVFYRPDPIGDYMEDMTWSLNNHYIVIRDGGSGMGDADLGRMACLDVGTQQTYQLGLSVGRPVWISPHTLKFWRPDFSKQDSLGIVKAPYPSFWSVSTIGKKRKDRETTQPRRLAGSTTECRMSARTHSTGRSICFC